MNETIKIFLEECNWNLRYTSPIADLFQKEDQVLELNNLDDSIEYKNFNKGHDFKCKYHGLQNENIIMLLCAIGAVSSNQVKNFTQSLTA